MGIKPRRAPFVWLLLAAVGVPAAAEDRPEKPIAPEILPTQLTLRLDPLQGRATVVAITEQTLTIVTAAHFLSPQDVGRTIVIQRDTPLRGRLKAVTQNPGYQPLPPRTSDAKSVSGTVGVDTAIAIIKVDIRRENERRTFAKIRPAEWTRDPMPKGLRQIVSVAIVDQHGHEHLVRAGNHLNPRCLAWGRQNYDTQRGDSGAGVFLMGKTPEGEPSPILIGNVALTDERGGLASLANRSDYWVVRAMAGLPAESQ